MTHERCIQQPFSAHRGTRALSDGSRIAAGDLTMRFAREHFGREYYRRYYLRSEEHTSELQSRLHLVCRLLLEKKICSRSAGPLLAPCRLAHRQRQPTLKR